MVKFIETPTKPRTFGRGVDGQLKRQAYYSKARVAVTQILTTTSMDPRRAEERSKVYKPFGQTAACCYASRPLTEKGAKEQHEQREPTVESSLEYCLQYAYESMTHDLELSDNTLGIIMAKYQERVEEAGGKAPKIAVYYQREKITSFSRIARGGKPFNESGVRKVLAAYGLADYPVQFNKLLGYAITIRAFLKSTDAQQKEPRRRLEFNQAVKGMEEYMRVTKGPFMLAPGLTGEEIAQLRREDRTHKAQGELSSDEDEDMGETEGGAGTADAGGQSDEDGKTSIKDAEEVTDGQLTTGTPKAQGQGMAGTVVVTESNQKSKKRSNIDDDNDIEEQDQSPLTKKRLGGQLDKVASEETKAEESGKETVVSSNGKGSGRAPSPEKLEITKTAKDGKPKCAPKEGHICGYCTCMVCHGDPLYEKSAKACGPFDMCGYSTCAFCDTGPWKHETVKLMETEGFKVCAPWMGDKRCGYRTCWMCRGSPQYEESKWVCSEWGRCGYATCTFCGNTNPEVQEWHVRVFRCTAELGGYTPAK